MSNAERHIPVIYPDLNLHRARARLTVGVTKTQTSWERYGDNGCQMLELTHNSSCATVTVRLTESGAKSSKETMVEINVDQVRSVRDFLNRAIADAEKVQS